MLESSLNQLTLDPSSAEQSKITLVAPSKTEVLLGCVENSSAWIEPVNVYVTNLMSAKWVVTYMRAYIDM
jgi:hypothetical protein